MSADAGISLDEMLSGRISRHGKFLVFAALSIHSTTALFPMPLFPTRILIPPGSIAQSCANWLGAMNISPRNGRSPSAVPVLTYLSRKSSVLILSSGSKDEGTGFVMPNARVERHPRVRGIRWQHASPCCQRLHERGKVASLASDDAPTRGSTSGPPASPLPSSALQHDRPDPSGSSAFPSERSSSRPHQRSYAALPTALRCIACHSGVYTHPQLQASLLIFLCVGGHDRGT